MKALVLSSLSGIQALSIKESPEPVAKPAQTLVRVTAGGLNFADIMTTKGGYPGMPAPPVVVGREFSGAEESTGAASWATRNGAPSRKAPALTPICYGRSP